MTTKYLKICIILLTVLYTVPVLGICQLFHLGNFCLLATMFCFLLSFCICLFKEKLYENIKRVEKRYFVNKKHNFFKS